jgi:hypothetical protein
VRGTSAYVAVPEPRLLVREVDRVYFLRETPSHVIVLCTTASGAGRVLVRLPRTGEGWDGWASSPGGALLAAYLAGAYRDMVVPLDVEPFAEHLPTPATGASAGPARLEPVGYLPARRRPRRRGPAALIERVRPAPHQVTWYIRRLAPGQRAHPEALARAAAVGMTVPPGYTFVDTYFWPRATDPRSTATALRATVAVSNLRALLQTATAQPPGLVADEAVPTQRSAAPVRGSGGLSSAGTRAAGATARAAGQQGRPTVVGLLATRVRSRGVLTSSRLGVPWPV